MDPIEKRELKRKAWLKLAAQRRRAGLLRGRVVIASLICFVLLWGVVFVQMATGNDPVLSAKKKIVATRTATKAKRKVEADPVEAEPEVEEDRAAEVEEPEPEAEPVESEFVEPEPLVTSQS
jgi:hypothetical protein